MPYTPYDPVGWKNKNEPGAKPINKDNFKHMEDGIVNLENNTIFYQELGTIDETTGEITLYETEATNNEEE